MNVEKLINFCKNVILDGEKIIVPSNFHDTLVFIVSEYSYDILKEITAVDLGSEIELIYRLYSMMDDEEVILSTKVQDSADSIIDIFKSAQADENEIYDLFGVKFIGNNNLKRLYLPQSWEGHPLRKDYVQDDTRLAWNDKDNA